MAVARRMGPAGSEVWHSMLDGAETVLREEGYGALTSRRVAEVIGVKQRLIYYYFENMEDLIVATFRRCAARDIERLTDSLSGDVPFEEIWERCVDTADSRMTAEFIALANRIDQLRAEVITYTEQTRQMLSDAIARSIASNDRANGLPPVAAAFLASSAAIALHREAALGITMGHEEVLAGIRVFFSRRKPA